MKVVCSLRDMLCAGSNQMTAHGRLQVAPSFYFLKKTHLQASCIGVIVIVRVWWRRDDERGKPVPDALTITGVGLQKSGTCSFRGRRSGHVGQDYSTHVVKRSQRRGGCFFGFLGQHVLPLSRTCVRTTPKDAHEREPCQLRSIGAVVRRFDRGPKAIQFAQRLVCVAGSNQFREVTNLRFASSCANTDYLDHFAECFGIRASGELRACQSVDKRMSFHPTRDHPGILCRNESCARSCEWIEYSHITVRCLILNKVLRPCPRESCTESNPTVDRQPHVVHERSRRGITYRRLGDDFGKKRRLSSL